MKNEMTITPWMLWTMKPVYDPLNVPVNTPTDARTPNPVTALMLLLLVIGAGILLPSDRLNSYKLTTDQRRVTNKTTAMTTIRHPTKAENPIVQYLAHRTSACSHDDKWGGKERLLVRALIPRTRWRIR